MSKALINTYRQRKEQFEVELAQVKAKSNRVVILRLIVFVGGIALFYGLLKMGTPPSMMFLFTVSTIALFLFLVNRFQDLKEKSDHLKKLVQVNIDEEAALNGKFASFKNGNEYIIPDHPYAFDLDIFGDGSIFQFINRSATGIGYERLAFWLLEPSLEKEVIQLRHEATKELSEKLDWRQHFLAIGLTHEELNDDRINVIKWSREPAVISKKKLLVFASKALPILTIAALIAGAFEFTTFLPFGILFFLQLGLLYSYGKVIEHQHYHISQKVAMLKKYALLMKAIEGEDFKSPHLISIKQQLFKDGKKASKIFNGLVKIANALDRRSSPIVAFVLNGIVMHDIRQIQDLETWKDKYRKTIPDWFEVIAEWDALNSLANLWYNHPKYCFPVIKEDFFYLEAEEMGHPLLDEEGRVDNDLNMIGNKQYRLITGANMAGKSTFLRSVGVNLVLAMAGAPVCAKAYTFSPCHISTSMRTNDSIQKHESYFYAELKRLKGVVDQLRDGIPTFVMLDEMLKGTNSKDQHAGSKALIEQMLQYDGAGLIATHDLSLGVLEKEYPGQVRNQCFEISIDGDHLQFDYKLKDGLNQHLNASFLMRKMGITHKPEHQGTS